MDDRPRTYEALGIVMTFHAFPGEVQDKYCLVEAAVPPGLGAPPNHHAGETEAFYVLDGLVRFMIAGEEHEVGPGGHVAIPDGALHAFTAVRPSRLLILNAPGHMHEQFFTSIGRPVPDGTQQAAPAGPPDLPAVMAAAERAGMTLMPPPGA